MAHSTHSIESILDLRIKARIAFGFKVGTARNFDDPGEGSSVGSSRVRVILEDGTEHDAPAWLTALIVEQSEDDMIFEAESNIEDRRAYHRRAS